MSPRDMMYINRDDDIWKVDRTTTPGIEYYGYTAPGTQDSQANWKISALTMDENGLMVSKLFAGGTPAYVNVWSNRASLSYS